MTFHKGEIVRQSLSHEKTKLKKIRTNDVELTNQNLSNNYKRKKHTINLSALFMISVTTLLNFKTCSEHNAFMISYIHDYTYHEVSECFPLF